MYTQQDFKDTFRKYRNYIIIGITSVLLLIICPFLGESLLGGGFSFPVTAAGWFLWGGTKIATAAANLVIFDSFTKQGRLNVKEDSRFLEAKQLMTLLKSDDEILPIDPRVAERKTYWKKAATIFITSIASTFIITQAILTFNWIQMISYLVTIAMGLIFGIEQQAYVEVLWTDTYLEFAKYKVKQLEKEQQNKLSEEKTE